MTDQRIRPKASAYYVLFPNISLAKASHMTKEKQVGSVLFPQEVTERIGWTLLLQRSMIQPPSLDHVIVSSPTGRVAFFVSLSVRIAPYSVPAEESNDSRPVLVPGGFCAPQTAPGGYDITGQKDECAR